MSEAFPRDGLRIQASSCQLFPFLPPATPSPLHDPHPGRHCPHMHTNTHTHMHMHTGTCMLGYTQAQKVTHLGLEGSRAHHMGWRDHP